MIIPYSPGGGFDVYGRITAKHMEKYLPSNTNVAVENVAGAGGLLGTNKLYLSKPDGLTIGLLNYPGILFAELTGTEGVQFKLADFSWLGRVAANYPVVSMNPNSPYSTVESFLNATDTVRFAVGGKGSDSYFGALLFTSIFGIKTEMLTGHDNSNEAALAIIRGEADGHMSSIDEQLPQIEQGNFTPLFFVGLERTDRLPDVMTAIEAGRNDDERQLLTAFTAIYNLERLFAAPPGTDPAVVAYLRDVFTKTLTDEEFIAELEAAGRGYNYASGDEVEKLAGEVTKAVEDLVPMLEEAQ